MTNRKDATQIVEETSKSKQEKTGYQRTHHSFSDKNKKESSEFPEAHEMKNWTPADLLIFARWKSKCPKPPLLLSRRQARGLHVCFALTPIRCRRSLCGAVL